MGKTLIIHPVHMPSTSLLVPTQAQTTRVGDYTKLATE